MKSYVCSQCLKCVCVSALSQYAYQAEQEGPLPVPGTQCCEYLN